MKGILLEAIRELHDTVDILDDPGDAAFDRAVENTERLIARLTIAIGSGPGDIQKQIAALHEAGTLDLISTR